MAGLELAAAERDLAAGNWRGALNHYRQILDIAPANPQALRGLETGREKLRGQLAQLVARGSELLTKGELSPAEVTFQQALELDPYQREALAAVKRIAQLKSVGIRPGDQQRLYLQGIEYYTRGRYDQAVASYNFV